MNQFPNSTTSAAQQRFIEFTSNIGKLQDDNKKLKQQRQREQYHDQEIEVTDDGSTILEFEVLSDEFAIDSNDECGNSVATNLPTNKTPAQWSRDTIYYLIGTYKRLARDEACRKTNFGTTVIWTEVSRKLMQRGFNYTPEQCRTKWTLLKKLYQHIRNETQLQKFEFIEAIHDYYKNPKIERLLEEARKNAVVLPQRRPRRMKDKSKVAVVETEVNSFNANNFIPKYEPDECETTNLAGLKEFASHNYSLDVLQEDSESVSFKLEIETSTCEEEGEVYKEEPKSFDESQADLVSDLNVTTSEQQSHFIEEFKKIVASQEQRRDERHEEKLRMFCAYNERLLAQQEEAIALHKQLMERLIANL